jgi:hypothetical protein
MNTLPEYHTELSDIITIDSVGTSLVFLLIPLYSVGTNLVDNVKEIALSTKLVPTPPSEDATKRNIETKQNVGIGRYAC